MMNINSLKQRINQNVKFKKFIHGLIMSRRNTRPRLWVRLFVNPILLKRGRGSVIKCNARMNVSPINAFSLGRGSVIDYFCVVDNGVGAVTVGDNTRVGIRSTLIGPVSIGNRCILAQNIVISGLNHNYEDVNTPIRKQGITTKPITIEDDVWICANCVITSGVTIGCHSVVAAGSVVVRNVPPYTLCAGVPAVVIKRFDFDLNKWVKVS